jgi:hypothetical protein
MKAECIDRRREACPPEAGIESFGLLQGQANHKEPKMSKQRSLASLIRGLEMGTGGEVIKPWSEIENRDAQWEEIKR